MAAKIWNGSAFQDAETPKVFVNGTAVDTEGKLWNGSAFEDEAWSGDMIIYNGLSYNDKWGNYNYTPSLYTGQPIYMSDRMRFPFSNNGGNYCATLNDPVSIGNGQKYRYINIEAYSDGKDMTEFAPNDTVDHFSFTEDKTIEDYNYVPWCYVWSGSGFRTFPTIRTAKSIDNGRYLITIDANAMYTSRGSLATPYVPSGKCYIMLPFQARSYRKDIDIFKIWLSKKSPQ